jgi:predicted ribosomally synthesized peptide with SipW-like signal peptide
MKSWSKLAMTAGAIGAIGVAGSFGTFAAFTASESKSDTITSGTIKVQNDFALPDWQNLGTADTIWPGGTTTPAYKKAGHITVKNTGSLAQDVYIDFDGPGVEDATSPNVESSDVLASNIIVDSSTSADYSTPGDDATRLYKLNRRGPTKVFTLEPGVEKTLFFRAFLRERAPGVYAGGDNEMQDKTLNEKVTVSAVEVGRDDVAGQPVVGGPDDGKNYDYGN